MPRHDSFQTRDNLVYALFAVPAAALLIWYVFSGNPLPALLLDCYVLIAVPAYMLVGSYPPVGSRWFWKSMLPIAALVSLGIYIQVRVTVWFHQLGANLPARMAFGITGCFAILEAIVASQIVNATEPKGTRD